MNGIVHSVDRTTETVEATLTNGQYLPEVPYIDFPPIAGDTAKFLEVTPSRWICLGVIGEALRPQDYTPQLTAVTTNPTLGTGSMQRGRYVRIGTFVHVRIQILFGSSGTNPGSGVYKVSLPFNSENSEQDIFGTGYIWDASTGTHRLVIAEHDSASQVWMRYDNSTWIVDDAHPWTWSVSDGIWLALFYVAA